MKMSDAQPTMPAPMTLKLTDEGAPVQDGELDAFEIQVGIRLPAEYRAFLKSHNGGRVEPATLGAHPTAAIQYFVSIGPPIDAARTDLLLGSRGGRQRTYTYDNLYFVAASLDDLLANLYD